MALTGISEFCALNRGGLASLDYAPLSNINVNTSRRIISDAGNWVFALQFSSGTWLSMPILPRGDVWEEVPVDDAQGVRYNQTLRTTVPGLRPGVQVELDEMQRMRFVIRLTDTNGRTWLIGDLDEGLKFTAQATTSERNGLNAYDIQFQGVTRRRAPEYDPTS